MNIFLSSEMVNLDSYDSEGPLTPETDDSTEVRSKIFYIIHSFLYKPFLSFEGPFCSHRQCLLYMLRTWHKHFIFLI